MTLLDWTMYNFGFAVSSQGHHMGWFPLGCCGHGTTWVLFSYPWTGGPPFMKGCRRVTSHQPIPPPPPLPFRRYIVKVGIMSGSAPGTSAPPSSRSHTRFTLRCQMGLNLHLNLYDPDHRDPIMPVKGFTSMPRSNPPRL